MLRIVLDTEKCLRCHACENACAAVHSSAGTFIGAVLAGEKPHSAVRMLLNPKGGVFALRCRHCLQPECVSACPVGAMKRDTPDGPVWCDTEECIGCFLCADACPVGAIGRYEDVQHPFKCDLCRGREGGPACVEACPTGALTFAEIDEEKFEALGQALLNNVKGV